MAARPRPAASAASAAFAALAMTALVLPSGLAGCDDMNRPAYVPKSEPRKQCFSDVECPGKKCVKAAGNDIQGVCGEADAGSTEGGAAPGAESGAPAPTVQPAPGDIQL